MVPQKSRWLSAGPMESRGAEDEDGRVDEEGEEEGDGGVDRAHLDRPALVLVRADVGPGLRRER